MSAMAEFLSDDTSNASSAIDSQADRRFLTLSVFGAIRVDCDPTKLMALL